MDQENPRVTDRVEPRFAEVSGLEMPSVSVIVLNWNQSALTINCINQLMRHVEGVSCEIIVVDNGSVKSQLDLLRKQIPPSATLISLNENLFFGEANNIGVEAAGAEYVLLLNNDVEIKAGLFASLMRVFKEEYSPGAVGPTFLYPDGSVQEAGAFILPNGWTFQHGKSSGAIDEHFRSGNHVVDYCSAACLLLKRDVFLNLGGFDPLFDPAYFEDADLGLRLRSIGLFTYFCADAEVVHHEGVTSSKVWSSSQKNEVVIENHRKLFSRWRTYLETRLISDVWLPEFEPLVPRHGTASRAVGRKKMLLCASALMNMSGACEGLLRVAAALEGEYDMTFAAAEACSRIRIASLCRNFGVKLDHFQVVRFSVGIVSNYDCVVLADDWGASRGDPMFGNFIYAKDVLKDPGYVC